MKKSAKIWLYFALVMSVCATILNITQQRWASIAISIVALGGLCLLLFKEKKLGFYIMCASNTLSFIVGIFGGIQGGTSIFLSIVMSLVGSAVVPVITYLFLRKQYKQLQ